MGTKKKTASKTKPSSKTKAASNKKTASKTKAASKSATPDSPLSPSDLVAALAAQPNKTCEGYLGLLETLSQHPLQVEAAEVHTALSIAASYYLFPDAPPVLRPRSFGGGPRPNELSGEAQTALASVADDLPLDLRARIRDVLWESARDPSVARLAMQDYASSALLLARHGMLGDVSSRIDRALGLARMMREDESAVVSTAVRIVKNHRVPGAARVSVASVLHRRGVEELDGIGAIVERIARRRTPPERGGFDWDGHRRTWEVAAAIYKSQGDMASERRVLVERAETYGRQAEWLAQAGAKAMLRVNLLQKGILEFSRLGGREPEEGALRAILQATQNDAVSEFATITGDAIDFSDTARAAMDAVKGRSWRDAMMELVGLVESPNLAKLRAQAARSKEQYPLLFLLPREVVDREGRTVAVENGEELTRRHMLEGAALHRQWSTTGVINPARRQILSEHAAPNDAWVALLSQSPFFEPSRAACWTMGLDAALRGNWIVSVHVLVPQIEQFVRLALRSRGHSTTDIERHGVERGNPFGALLHHRDLPNILGEDLVFDLKALLIDPGGLNLRNYVAHGMLSDAEFHAGTCAYAWHLSLRLLLVPVLVRELTAGESGSGSGTE